MKCIFWNVIPVAALVLANGVALGDPLPTEAFLYAKNEVDSIAACLVTVSNSNTATSSCLCAASGGQFSFCAVAAGAAVFGVHPQFATAWGTAVGMEKTALSKTIADWGNGSLLLDARASCTLDQAALELALSQDADKSKLQGILGSHTRYSAIYMWPTVGGTAVADPIRLCALGQSSVITAGTLIQRLHDEQMGGRGHQASFNPALQTTGIGITGGFEWAVTTPPNQNNPYPTAVGVEFLLVAVVDDTVVQTGGEKNINAIGVLANAKLTDLTLHIESKPALGPSFDVENKDPPPSP